jgi:DNA-binding HxlR family transcriptional regulator
MKPSHPEGTDCRPVTDILVRIGDKWSVMVVMNLQDGKKRFSELRRALLGISQKMLTTTLRSLERDGFIRRIVCPTVPPKVEYELTDLGVDLAVPVMALGEWAIRNRPRVLEARDAYDRATGRSLAVSATGTADLRAYGK